jgi:hypothetical protein
MVYHRFDRARFTRGSCIETLSLGSEIDGESIGFLDIFEIGDELGTLMGCNEETASGKRIKCTRMSDTSSSENLFEIPDNVIARDSERFVNQEKHDY